MNLDRRTTKSQGSAGLTVGDPLHTRLSNVVEKLSSYKNRNSRSVAAQFLSLPDKAEHPTYYEVIRHPRCLLGVQQALAYGFYETPHQVYADLKLVFLNAQHFNNKSSLVFSDSTKVENILDELWSGEGLPLMIDLGQRDPSLNEPAESTPAKKRRAEIPSPPASIPGQRLRPTRAELGSMTEAIHQEIFLQQSNGSGAELEATAFHALMGEDSPLVVNESVSDLMDGVIPTPPLPTPVTSARPRKRKKSAMSPDDEDEDDVSSTSPGKPKRKVREIEKRDPDVESGWMPDSISQLPRAVYLDILSKLRSEKDPKTGKTLLSIILDAQVEKAQEDTTQTPTLESIEAKVRSDSYVNAEAFDRDLYDWFNHQKSQIPRESLQLYGAALLLQRLYNELTRFDPDPALKKSKRLSTVTAGPGNLGPEDSQPSSKVASKDRFLMESLNYKGEVIKVGDYLHLSNPDNPEKPIICQVFKCYHVTESVSRVAFLRIRWRLPRVNSSPRTKGFTACWYYRPEETVHPITRQFYEHEVFKTGNFVDHAVEDILERCWVLFYTRYIRGRPKAPHWNPSMPTYVVEHRYKDDGKSFKKIKNWSSCIPEECRHNELGADIDRFNVEVTTLNKVKSPFVRGIEGPGRIGEPTDPEEDDGEQSKYCAPLDEEPTPLEVKANARKLKVGTNKSGADLSTPTPPTTAAGTPFTVGGPMGVVSNPLPLPLGPGARPSAPAASPAPAAPPIVKTLQNTASAEHFNPLPEGIAEIFRTDPANGELLWFASPPIEPPPRKYPVHSLEYLEKVVAARNRLASIRRGLS